MKNLPLVAHASLSNDCIDYGELDANTEDEALPAILDAVDGVVMSTKTRMTEVNRETTDDK